MDESSWPPPEGTAGRRIGFVGGMTDDGFVATGYAATGHPTAEPRVGQRRERLRYGAAHGGSLPRPNIGTIGPIYKRVFGPRIPSAAFGFDVKFYGRAFLPLP